MLCIVWIYLQPNIHLAMLKCMKSYEHVWVWASGAEYGSQTTAHDRLIVDFS